MLARLPAVVQDVGIVAAGVFKGVGEDGQALEGFLIVVDGLGQGGDVGCAPGGVQSGGVGGVAEDVSEQAAVIGLFCACNSRFLGIFVRCLLVNNGIRGVHNDVAAEVALPLTTGGGNGRSRGLSPHRQVGDVGEGLPPLDLPPGGV